MKNTSLKSFETNCLRNKLKVKRLFNHELKVNCNKMKSKQHYKNQIFPQSTNIFQNCEIFYKNKIYEMILTGALLSFV